VFPNKPWHLLPNSYPPIIHDHFSISGNALEPTSAVDTVSFIFSIRIVVVESILGPLGTSATEWPVVSAPGDYDAGEFCVMKIGRGNRSTQRKPAPAPLCAPQIPLARPGLEPRPPQWEASD
jgi:hypothetical protein